MRYTAFLILVTLTFTVHTEASQGADATIESRTPSELMAEELIGAARQATMSEPIDIHAIEAALVLATEATQLTPDDFSTWQVLHEVAQMADQQTLAATARENLLRLDPMATTLQLARLRDVVNRAQTAEERLDVYEQLLSESRQRQLDSRVAARLAFDAAELQRQLGDTTQFARWLAESVALDPAFSEAMTLATGFFGDESADVYRRAELLASTMLSNIRDITTQIALAEFLMAFGDYKDAQKIYDIISK